MDHHFAPAERRSNSGDREGKNMNIIKTSAGAERRRDYETPEVRLVGSVKEITKGTGPTRRAISEALGGGGLGGRASTPLPG
jgi:hypothetical protein